MAVAVSTEIAREDYLALMADIRRLAQVHQQLLGEKRFHSKLERDAIAALLELSLQPLELAIEDLGRAAAGKPPRVSVRT